MAQKPYADALMEEALRPYLEALPVLLEEIVDPSIPRRPWEKLGKRYEDLTPEEIVALLRAYGHQDGEEQPCQMCLILAEAELRRMRRDDGTV